jgi:transcription elongation factor GreA
MGTIQYYTEEGLKRLKDELQELKGKGRMDIAKQIAEARDKGDLSENAERSEEHTSELQSLVS